ncbi:hypothetical protein Bca52824_080115 [Brassica carinata]|uniref:4-hydroxy-tetrahydrodipicolinate synthase n=1 Tax=Brassica carinata TaxID=52824 RepID=A0A8X7U1E2_BRACI|nr:hypothetical protein Bca52824_080115 [Brassica carinata]
MAALKGYSLISIDSALHFPLTHQFEVYKRSNGRWVSPIAAVVPNFHLPLRSLKDKNRTNTDDIRSLRVITAIKTPYLPDGRFDLEAYDELVNTQIEKGAEGVIVGGKTGEGQLMSWDEHIMLIIGHTVNCFGARIKVVGNTMCPDSRWDHGATGVISITSNLVPGLMRKLMFEGRNSELNSKVMPLIDWVFQEPNPIGVNTALAQLGVARPVFRLPYVPLPMSKRVEFVKLVEEIGREHLVGERDVQVLDDDDFILIGRY